MRFYFDSETHLIKLGMVAPRPVAYGWAIDDAPVAINQRDHFRDLLREQLHAPNTRLTGHNVAFDFGCACAEWPELLPLVFRAYENDRVTDTMIVQHLIDIALGEHEFRRSGVNGGNMKTKHSLADLVWHYYGETLPKADTWRLRYGELDGVPIANWPEDARSYLVRDVVETRRIHQAQLGLVGTNDWAQKTKVPINTLPDLGPQHRASWWMWLMGSWGIRTNGVAVAKLRAELIDAIEKRGSILFAAGLLDGKGTKKTKPCQERVKAWYDAHGRKVPLTDGGAVSTSVDTLGETDDAALIAWSEYVSLDKMLGTYVEGRKEGAVGLMHGVDQPICARWNVLVDTGRTSCSKPNLQNPPRKGGVRPCIVAREGHVLISCDYDTAELRSLAQIQIDLFKTSALGDMLRAGMDPHLRLGGEVIGVSYDEMVRRKKESAIVEARQGGKAGNFGYPGGLGWESFIEYAWANYGIRVTPERSKEIKDAWFALYPEEKRRFDHVKALLDATNGVLRHHRSNRLRGDCQFTQAANSMFQGLTADGAKRAGWLLARECYGIDPGALTGSRIVMFLHDEFIMEVPELSREHVHRASLRTEELMIEGMRAFVPDVPITCSPAVTRRWYKGSEAVLVDGMITAGKPVGENGATRWVADVDPACAA